ncbi:ficolin-2-like [Asterias amurensis]|uniref:ficolin-2-like n=1 Tax=Asterias amurensis TaxID=7602 RepID=UPI003AB1651E
MGVITTFFLLLMVIICHSENPQGIGQTFYVAENRALLNHTFHLKTVASPVICGRDCSADPQCVSFNYKFTTRVCVLNNASRAHSPDDFVNLKGSLYYDDNVNNTSFSAPIIESYSSCLELYQSGYSDNGIYTIFPTDMTDGLHVYCDMETDGGGWIVFQRRQDGSVDFNRNWTEYQSGFGDLLNEFWLGNDILRYLTGSGQWELRVDMEDWQSKTSLSSYGEFAVKGNKYSLVVGSYDAQSTAGDSLTTVHRRRAFSTKDWDNDKSAKNCARLFRAAWWYHSCFSANLNGEYRHEPDVLYGEGIQWHTFKGQDYSLKKCSMKIRQVI